MPKYFNGCYKPSKDFEPKGLTEFNGGRFKGEVRPNFFIDDLLRASKKRIRAF